MPPALIPSRAFDFLLQLRLFIMVLDFFCNIFFCISSFSRLFFLYFGFCTHFTPILFNGVDLFNTKSLLLLPLALLLPFKLSASLWNDSCHFCSPHIGLQILKNRFKVMTSLVFTDKYCRKETYFHYRPIQKPLTPTAQC
jgi:hypothetical protein